MVIGEVAVDYAFFDFMVEDLENSIEMACDTLYMEYKLISLGYVMPTSGDLW
jgi:hypothetical protein